MREMKRSGSQNCAARGSEMRFRIGVAGAARSLSITGSQTTITFIGLLGNFFKLASIAEAPCKHVVQVGESRTRTRVESAAALKASISFV